MAGPLVCPACRSSTMIQTGGRLDQMRMTAVWEYSCPACHTDINVEGAASVDPEREINEYVRTGRPPSCSVTISRPAPRLSSYGISSWLPTVSMMQYVPGGRAHREIEPAPVPTPEPGPDLRALDGSVVGYRAWRINDWQLTGTGVNEAWVPGVNEAKCSGGYSGYSGRHVAPDPKCHCGLYGLARFDERNQWWSNADVLGAIEAWADEDATNHDRFFVHSIGFRAQYAKVILLATSDDYPRAKNAAIRALATEHGADVCKREHLEDAAREHGQLVPDDLLAWAKEGEPKDSEAFLNAGLRALAGSFQVPQTMFGSFVPQFQVSSYQSWGSRAAPAKPKRPKGIKQTLGYPGPPNHGKFRKGDRVRDRKGVIWTCSKGGQPGFWEGDGGS